MALTGKKLKFATAVLAGSSKKEAAIAAGYSAATASQSGSRMAKDPEIVAYLAEPRTKPALKATRAPAEAARGGESVDAPVKRYTDPADLLEDQMNDEDLDPRDRRDAAKALMPFRHQKLGEGGKKDQKQAAAEKVSTGKFGLRAVK